MNVQMGLAGTSRISNPADDLTLADWVTSFHRQTSLHHVRDHNSHALAGNHDMVAGRLWSSEGGI